MKHIIRTATALCLSLGSLLACAQNPLNFGSNIKTADPSGRVWADGKMYLYTSHDEECQEDFHMQDWHAFSSTDLVNWTAHGAILSLKDYGTKSDYQVVEMADDMRSIKGDFYKMDMGGYEPKMEGPWIFKRNGIYYFTMPENNRVLSYYTAKSPKGPWKYQGVIMDEENNANNHHSIMEYKGQWILFYHRWLKDSESTCHKKQRYSTAEYLYFNADGTIQKVERTDKGVSDFSARTKTAAKKVQ